MFTFTRRPALPSPSSFLSFLPLPASLCTQEQAGLPLEGKEQALGITCDPDPSPGPPPPGQVTAGRLPGACSPSRRPQGPCEQEQGRSAARRPFSWLCLETRTRGSFWQGSRSCAPPKDERKPWDSHQRRLAARRQRHRLHYSALGSIRDGGRCRPSPAMAEASLRRWVRVSPKPTCAGGRGGEGGGCEYPQGLNDTRNEAFHFTLMDAGRKLNMVQNASSPPV